MSIWLELKNLEGQTLKTLKQEKLFDIVDVNESVMIIRPQVRNQERPISRRAIEAAYQRLLATGQLTRADIRDEGFSEFNPAYVAAILAQLPNVTHVIFPRIKLSIES